MQTTPVYGLGYVTEDDPLVDLAAASETTAMTVEAALIQGGIAPAGVQDLISDSGWVNIAINATFAAQTGAVPRIRRIGKWLIMEWGWASTNIPLSATTTVGVIPATAPNGLSLRPPRDKFIGQLGVSTASAIAHGVIRSNGNVDVRTGSVASTYYLFDPAVFLAD